MPKRNYRNTYIRRKRLRSSVEHPSPSQHPSSIGQSKDSWKQGGNNVIPVVQSVPWYHHLTHLPGYNYCGPFTTVHGLPPKNELDARCMNHDLEYGKLGIGAYSTFNRADEDLIRGIRADRSGVRQNMMLPFGTREKLDGVLVELLFRAKQAALSGAKFLPEV